MFTFKHLRHAMAVARHGNFHRAALAENISQPALSRSVQALEAQLGVSLFDRQGHAITPTIYGNTFLKRSAKALEEAEELLREVDMLKGLEAGELRIAMGVYAAEMSASRAVGELLNQHANLNCRLQLTSWTNLAELVTSRTVDLGIGEVSTLGETGELSVEPIGRHRIILFCRHDHPLAGKVGLCAEDLRDYPTATTKLPPRAVHLFPGKMRTDPITGEQCPSIEIDDLASARTVIAHSDAFGVATPLQIQPWLERGEFQVLDFHAPWLQLNYGFIYLRDRMLSPAAQTYMGIVRRIERDNRLLNEALMQKLIPGAAKY